MAGGVRKRGKKWSYYFEMGRVDGKRQKKEKGGFNTKREAEAALAAAIAQYNQAGATFTASEISVADYLDYYYNNYVVINLRYNTQRNRLNIYENHIKPAFGKYKLKALNAQVLQEYVNKLKLDGLSKSTITGITAALNTALDYAVEPLHYIPDNPFRYVKMPKIENAARQRIILEPEQWARIIERFPENNRFYLPLMIGYYCGLRSAEAFALTWDDINLEARTISVNKQIIKRAFFVDARKDIKTSERGEKQSAWYFGEVKTATSRRIVTFGNTLYNALKNAKNAQEAAEAFYGDYYTIIVSKPEKDEKGNNITRLMPAEKSAKPAQPRVRLVMIDENGSYTSPDSFKYCARIIHNELQINFDYHSLRHTHATRIIEAGISPKAVQARLGHSNITTTLQVYVHATDEMAADAVEAFEAAATGAACKGSETPKKQ